MSRSWLGRRRGPPTLRNIAWRRGRGDGNWLSLIRYNPPPPSVGLPFPYSMEARDRDLKFMFPCGWTGNEIELSDPCLCGLCGEYHICLNWFAEVCDKSCEGVYYISYKNYRSGFISKLISVINSLGLYMIAKKGGLINE